MALQERVENKIQMALPSSTYVHPLSRTLSRWSARCGRVLLQYWTDALLFVLGLVVLTAVLIPVLSYLGLDVLAKPLFSALHAMCAQIPSHSFYLFGHQLGLCQRNLAIYGSMFLGSLVFVATKKRLPGIPWWLWLLLVLPMAWDGTTQLFGWRESTWALRVITGTLFGGGTVWFVLPLVHRLLSEGHAAWQR